MAIAYRFGPFALDVAAGILFCGDRPTMLGGRAVALLERLVGAEGAPISKDDLIEAAWPGLVVEDSNLTVQIAALRRALQEGGGASDWIATLPRRGYRYAGPAVVTAGAEAPPALALPGKASIAVLPFRDLSEDGSQTYFVDGLVDEIITGLARIKWLFVIARSSSFVYRSSNMDARRVGRDLGVRYVLQGSVLRTGPRVRVVAQLVDAETGGHVWAQKFERAAADLFALQDDIALSAVGAIEPGLRQAEVERVRRKRPESLDAYDLTLRAQPDVFSGMPDRSARGLGLLEKVLELEPDYALAHGYAAMAYHNRFLRAGLREDDRARSIHHARRALEHGRDDALALTFAGFSFGMDAHDRQAAFEAFEAARLVSPSTALTHILGSVVFAWQGESEVAIEWSERGMRLSPFDPWAFAAFDAQALGHFNHQRYGEACRAAYRSVQSNPGHSITYVQLAAALVRLGRLDEARVAAGRVLELQPNFRYGKQFAGVNCAPALAASLGEALRSAGLPE